MNAIGERLKTKWQSLGLSIRPGATEAALAEFERRYGVRLPSDMRIYLGTVDGMDGQMDDSLNSFWELARIRPIPEELPEPHYEGYRNVPGASSYFCFCDHSISALVWAIRLGNAPTDKNPVVVVTHDEHPVVARSFTEFSEKSLDDPMSLMAWENA